MQCWIWASSVPWQPKKPTVPRDASGPTLRAGWGKRLPHSALHGAASPQVLWEGLGSKIKEGHNSMREHPRKNCKDGEGSIGQGVWGVAEVPWSVQSREAEGRPHGSLQLLTGSKATVLSSALWWQWQHLRENNRAVSGDSQEGVRKRFCTKGPVPEHGTGSLGQWAQLQAAGVQGAFGHHSQI